MDQAQNLRKIAWGVKRRSTYISISSGKGGVGKTNFAVNISHTLARMGKKVLLFDADLGLANVDILLNLNVKTNIKDFLEGNISSDNLVVDSGYGFDVVPASSGFVNLTKLDEGQYDKLMDLFVKFDSKYDYIIFDTGAGIGENVIKFSSVSDMLVVITQPEPTAVTDAYAFIKVVNKEFNITRPYLVVNKSKTKEDGINIYENLKNVLKRFLDIDLELLGVIRDCKEVALSVREQKPIAETNPTSIYMRDLILVGKKIVNMNIEKNYNNELSSVFRRSL
ncbi:MULTISPECIES: MinD/ParA family protein [Calditerrivibrio]|jgi:flagellar biosynthesis protein FlhG|uniref:MinD/ParA family protein n=1 Tax=Calditerrivibrio nitroreducens TaxID=477976 RepID=A0A2J6WM25_9BACT|nr:MAG: MinD/ParA family protein [Calditerrivibrio nitroreducens]